MMASTKLGLLAFFIYFSVIIPKLRADPVTNVTLDTFWKDREAEGIKAALEAYDEFPLEVTNNFNKIVRRSEEAINRTRRYLVSSNYTGRGLLSYGRTYSYERTYSYRRTHSYVRTPHHRRKFRVGCQATNAIDRCWRCRRNWAQDRKRLASCPLGFGRRATGGRNGHFYVVTDSSDNDVQNPKPGTLRYGVIQNRPLWITFAHNMVIRLQQELIFTSHKTLDGRGANVHIAYGAGITIQFVKNVIIHNLHIHDTIPSYGGLIRDSVDHMGFRTMADGDGITIFGSCHIWLDHLSMYNCKDGLIDAIQGSTAITISNSYFTRHNDVILLGASDSYDHDKIMQVTVAFNHFGKHLIQRMPRCRWGFFHVVNNDYTQWEMYAIGGSSQPTIISQGNRFCAPNNPAAKEVTKRDYATESEWSHWTWRSEGDLLLNGAFFRQSGSPVGHRPTSRRDMIKAKSGRAVGRLTRFAGALDCHIGQKC